MCLAAIVLSIDDELGSPMERRFKGKDLGCKQMQVSWDTPLVISVAEPMDDVSGTLTGMARAKWTRTFTDTRSVYSWDNI